MTSMVVTTSRRTYHIQLKSNATQYMARVGFEYPRSSRQPARGRQRAYWQRGDPGAGVPAEQLNFAYSISGSASWRPTRVYSDGVKTYIQFPSSLSGQESPVLFVVSGGEIASSTTG